MTSSNPHAVCTPTDEQTANLQAWRAMALEKMPYMASMLFSLRCLNAPGLTTFAVDKAHRLYIDFDAVAEYGPRWCAEALLHECGHLFGEHDVRARDMGVQDQERRDWNYAGDFEINDDLRDSGCEMFRAAFAEQIGEEDYQTAEHYLAVIRKLREQQPQPQQSQKPQDKDGDDDGEGGSGGSGDGDDEGDQDGQGSGGNDDDGTQPAQDGGSGGGQSQGDFQGCGSASGGLPAPCELAPSDDLNGSAPGATATEQETTRIATAAAIRDAHSSGRGTVPAGLVERAEMLLKPSKLPWRRVLSSAVKRSVAMKMGDFDTTYTRRNRRRHGGRIVFPGVFSPQPNLVVVRDTSGSMGKDELTQVTVEVDAIARKVGVRGKDLRVIDVDAAVNEIRAYKGVKSLEEVSGRGGTDMCVGIEAAMALRPHPNAIVVITDGMTPWPVERLVVPLVICLVGPGAEAFRGDTPTWARTVVVDDL